MNLKIFRNFKLFTKSPTYSYSIHGKDTQIVEISLLPYQTILIEPNSITYIDPGITLDTKANTISSSFLGRVFSGSSLFVTEITNENERSSSKVALSSSHFSKILHFELEDLGEEFYFIPDSFLCSGLDVKIEAKYFGVTSTLMNSNYLMQKFRGKGSVFVKAGICVKEIDLNEGESLVVSKRALLGFSKDIKVNINVFAHLQWIYDKNLIMWKLSGPGKVLVQAFDKEGFESKLMDVMKGYGLTLADLPDLSNIFDHGKNEENKQKEDVFDDKEELNTAENDLEQNEFADDDFLNDSIDSKIYVGGPNDY